jgi:hypothetical protein
MAVIADYESNVTVDAICKRNDIGLTRLYRILDRHRIARRQPNAPKLPTRLRQRILSDYVMGVDVSEIARRHGVSVSTVCNVAARHGVGRMALRTRDQLIELGVQWFIGILQIGCRTTQPGLRALDHLDPAIADDVTRRLIDVLQDRCRLGSRGQPS